MTRVKLWLGWSLLLTIGVLAGACSSGSGANAQACEETCAFMNQCDPVEYDLDDCRDDCGQFADLMRSTAFDSMVECIQATDCADLDPEECMQQAMDEVPASVLNSFFNTICGKVVECQGGDQQACLDQMQGDEDLENLKIFSDAGLNCLGSCLTGLSCAELAAQDPLEDCVTQCGLSFDDESPNECEDISGGWTLESASCSGTPADLTGYAMDMDIQQDCYFTLERTVSSGCTATYEGYYQPVGGPYRWIVDYVECSIGCTSDECTSGGLINLEAEVSVDLQSGDMVFNMNVPAGMVEAGLAPCESGFQVLVWGP